MRRLGFFTFMGFVVIGASRYEDIDVTAVCLPPSVATHDLNEKIGIYLERWEKGSS